MRIVSPFFSWPKKTAFFAVSPPCCSMKWLDWTNIPPEPQAGSNTTP